MIAIWAGRDYAGSASMTFATSSVNKAEALIEEERRTSNSLC
jgi:hypothetical protein